mmetsp:Transcript_29588/g.70993  ORF Transcript_29588/g.70993 Transcript_29588/m.70993 type:complete len:571 (+) Transcript_29588:147-1859(+)
MRLLWTVGAPLLLIEAASVRRAQVSVDTTRDVWVPIDVGEAGKPHLHYFNPETSEMSHTLPSGSEAAPVVSLMQKASQKAHLSNDGSELDAGAAGVGTQDSESDSISSVTTTGEHRSCYPHCSWNCTQPVCNQDCTPQCEQPRCQTRCPRPDYNDCAIDCETPHCTVFCPKDACKGEEAGESKCSSPRCSTQCARPICRLKCKGMLPCQNVCQPPQCLWNCRNPKECAKPQCKLVCERPMGCARNYELPPLSPSLTVQQNFKADRARWVTYSWGQCGMRCGKSVRTRKVVCSTGQDHGCTFAPKPPTQEECEDNSQCNGWITEAWGECSVKCGRGERTRKVFCRNEDQRECYHEKPSSVEKCIDRGEHCTQCDVELYGGAYFDGWKAPLGPGSYSTDQLVQHGVKCEEISSVKVIGRCCHARLYQYGDFNQRHKGWKVTVGSGNYDADALEDQGARDNDISAVKIWLDKTCSTAGHRWQRLQGQDGEGGGRSTVRDALSEPMISSPSTSPSSEAAPDDKDSSSGAAQSGEAQEKEPSLGQTWWFWLILGLLVLLVGVGVYMAVRRRNGSS